MKCCAIGVLADDRRAHGEYLVEDVVEYDVAERQAAVKSYSLQLFTERLWQSIRNVTLSTSNI